MKLLKETTKWVDKAATEKTIRIDHEGKDWTAETRSIEEAIKTLKGNVKPIHNLASKNLDWSKGMEIARTGIPQSIEGTSERVRPLASEDLDSYERGSEQYEAIVAARILTAMEATSMLCPWGSRYEVAKGLGVFG